MSFWTTERVELLKRLWPEGGSCARIAAEIGCSRSAVLGKAHRIGLPHRADTVPINRTRGARKVRRSGAGYVALDTETIENDPSIDEIESSTPPDSFLGISFANLQPAHCRYPRTVDGSILFCGQPQTEDSSYCAECHQRCHPRFRRVTTAGEMRDNDRGVAA